MKSKLYFFIIIYRSLTFTCVKSTNDVRRTNNFFRLPKEPVRPIDPVAWIESCNAIKELQITESKFIYNINILGN